MRPRSGPRCRFGVRRNWLPTVSPPIDAVVHAVEWLDRDGCRADVIVMLQASSPLRTAAHIDEAVALFHASGVDTVTSVSTAASHPYWCWKPDGAEIKPFFSPQHIAMPRHQLPPALIENGAVYVFRRDLLSAGTIYGRSCCRLSDVANRRRRCRHYRRLRLRGIRVGSKVIRLMAFEILSADGKNAERWSTLIGALSPELRDIHFLPEYGRIYHDTYRQEPFLALCEEDGEAVLQPFVRRPLADLPFLKSSADARQFADIANPYGYGGPLCTSRDRDVAQRLYRKFADNFAAWCEREGIASEFTSLHPLLVEHQLPMVETVLSPRFEKDVVVISLAGDDVALRSQLSRGQKSNVAKARRAGVTVRKVEANTPNLATFNEIYYATMQRHGAADRWFFPENYFANCVSHLGEASHIAVLCLCWRRGRKRLSVDPRFRHGVLSFRRHPRSQPTVQSEQPLDVRNGRLGPYGGLLALPSGRRRDARAG